MSHRIVAQEFIALYIYEFYVLKRKIFDSRNLSGYELIMNILSQFTLLLLPFCNLFCYFNFFSQAWEFGWYFIWINLHSVLTTLIDILGTSLEAIDQTQSSSWPNIHTHAKKDTSFNDVLKDYNLICLYLKPTIIFLVAFALTSIWNNSFGFNFIWYIWWIPGIVLPLMNCISIDPSVAKKVIDLVRYPHVLVGKPQLSKIYYCI